MTRSEEAYAEAVRLAREGGSATDIVVAKGGFRGLYISEGQLIAEITEACDRLDRALILPNKETSQMNEADRQRLATVLDTVFTDTFTPQHPNGSRWGIGHHTADVIAHEIAVRLMDGLDIDDPTERVDFMGRMGFTSFLATVPKGEVASWSRRWRETGEDGRLAMMTSTSWPHEAHRALRLCRPGGAVSVV